MNRVVACTQARINRNYEWSVAVKANAGWVCSRCGEMDSRLLEAHHIKPRHKFPDLRLEVGNGECLCMFHHAASHVGWSRALILARMGLLLLKRSNQHMAEEIEAMTI